MFGIDDLFDLDGNGKLDGVEMAFAYSVVFGSEEEQGNDNFDLDFDRDDDNDWEEE